MSNNCCHSKNRKHQSATWSKCLKDGSGACIKPTILHADSVNAPHASQMSKKMRTAQIIKPSGATVYGRWRTAKYNTNTKSYTILGNSRRNACE